MDEEELIRQFWEATLGDEPVDHEAYLAKGGKKMAAAVNTHLHFQRAARPTPGDSAPLQLGRFQILSELGTGGMGRVYLGWDPELRRQVAIKVIARDRWAANEARAIAQLEHRSIVKVYEVGPDRLVMELLAGGSLKEKIEELRAHQHSFLTPLRQRLHCLVRIAQGLAYSHKHGVLHRDVKPGNVLFAKQDEHPRLMDFGLAHHDESESLDITQNLVGTPAYLAPEQIESNETGSDFRSDIFSFGVLAYELLTLEPAFKRSTRTATLEAVTAAHPRTAHRVNRQVPRPVTHILEHCLEPLPDRRYGSMHEVVSDLQATLANRPISVGSRSPVHRLQLFFQRNRLAAGFATAGLGIAVVVGLGLWLISLSVQRKEFGREIGALTRRIAESHTLFSIQATGNRLLVDQLRAKLLDESSIGRALLLDSEALVATTCDTWSRHLNDELTRLSEDKSRESLPSEWRSLVHLDAQLLPHSTWNQARRTRGLVSLSPELDQRRDELLIYRQGAKGPGPLLSTVAWKLTTLEPFPEPGFYRVELPGEWQREFNIESPWSDPVALEFPTQRLDASDWYPWEAEGYRVSPLISNQLVARYCNVVSLGPHYLNDAGLSPHLEGPENSPAQVSHNLAMAFAAWAGGRLLTATEVATFLNLEDRTPEALLDAEFVTNLPFLAGPSTAGYFHYRIWNLFPDKYPATWLGQVMRYARVGQGLPPGTPPSQRLECGFRLLYLSRPHPEAPNEQE